MLNHAFNDLNLNRIQLRVLENNESAINLYKAVGFKEEGLLREVVIKNNEYQNMFIMSILNMNLNIIHFK